MRTFTLESTYALLFGYIGQGNPSVKLEIERTFIYVFIVQEVDIYLPQYTEHTQVDREISLKNATRTEKSCCVHSSTDYCS